MDKKNHWGGQLAILRVSNFMALLEKHVSCWAELKSNLPGNGCYNHVRVLVCLHMCFVIKIVSFAVMFMRANIVGTVIILSLVIWIPASCIVAYIVSHNSCHYSHFL